MSFTTLANPHFEPFVSISWHGGGGGDGGIGDGGGGGGGGGFPGVQMFSERAF